jgi:hypothetical protein
MTGLFRPGGAQRGFSYAEILLSVVLLAVLLVPALQALTSGIAGYSGAQAPRQLDLRNKMEQVLSKPFKQVYAETYKPGGNTTTSVSSTFSDASGAAARRVVVFYRYDIDTKALSSDDTGLLYVNVYYQADGSTNGLNTLVGRWW